MIWSLASYLALILVIRFAKFDTPRCTWSSGEATAETCIAEGSAPPLGAFKERFMTWDLQNLLLKILGCWNVHAVHAIFKIHYGHRVTPNTYTTTLAPQKKVFAYLTQDLFMVQRSAQHFSQQWPGSVFEEPFALNRTQLIANQHLPISCGQDLLSNYVQVRIFSKGLLHLFRSI